MPCTSISDWLVERICLKMSPVLLNIHRGDWGHLLMHAAEREKAILDLLAQRGFISFRELYQAGGWVARDVAPRS